MEDRLAALLRTCATSSDARAWAAFDRLLRPRLAATVTRALWRCGQTTHPELVTELIQETYCRLLSDDRQVLRRFRGGTDGEAHAYLTRVAASVTVDRLRARSAAKRGADLLVDETSDAESISRHARDPGVSPETRLLRRDLWRRFWHRCAHLSGSRDRKRDMTIVALALIHGWTSQEIARSQKLPASTVDTIIHRVRQRLARRGVYLPSRSGTQVEVAEPGPSEPCSE